MAHNAARPKRAAEDYARTHHEVDFDGQHSKKPRFDIRNPSALAPDALEDDAVLEADVIGSRGQQVRRGAVNIDGYDSDSDNENFNARADARAKEKDQKSKDEEEADMFADLDEDFKDGDNSEGDTTKGGGKKKAVRFIDGDEIEGQVQNSKSGGHVSADFSLSGKRRDIEMESSSDSEVDDEVRASTGELDSELGAGSKKSHAPKLDAFNMKNEQEEGRFDDQGNFVRKAADPDAIHDLWMEGVSKKDMKKAREAAEKREADRRQRDIEDDSKSDPELLATLISMLEPGETVLEALARLGKNRERKPKWQIKRKNNKGRETVGQDLKMHDMDPVEDQRRQAVEKITGAADMLLTRGQPEIYEAERELLLRQYRKDTGEDWKESSEPNANSEHVMTIPTSANLWQYRWIDARDGGVINGPFEATMMRQWNAAGYFGEGVEYRRDGDTEWNRVAEFV